MNKDRLFNEYKLDVGLKKLIEEQEIITGKEFKVIEKPDLSVRATIKIARNDMSNHIIYVQSLKMPFLNHLIAHELGHFVRMTKVPESERLVPSVTDRNILNFRKVLENSLQKRKYPLKKEILQNLITIWHNGLISQLTNLPVDYRIEFWIYEYFPNIRAEQKASVEEDLKTAINGLSKEVETLTPSFIYIASHAMNYAFAKVMDLLLRTDYLKHYSDTLIKEKGEKLYKLLATEDLGYTRDIIIINSWAEIINAKEWFTWAKFNDIPQDYVNKIL